MALPRIPLKDVALTAGLLAVGLLMYVLLWFTGRPDGGVPLAGFPLDDAWIHMVYGQGLARDGFLSYNPGVPTTGATSPLWACVLALLHVASDDVDTIVRSTYFVNVAIALAVIWATALTARSAGLSPFVARCAALLVASSTLFLISAFTGMEVLLTSLLLLLGTAAYLRKRWLFAGLFLGLAGLARPESAFLIMAFTVSFVLTRRGEYRSKTFWKQALCFALPPVLFAGGIVLYFLWATGRPMPATFYIKQSVDLAHQGDRMGAAMFWVFKWVVPFRYAMGWLACGGLLYGFFRKYEVSRSAGVFGLGMLYVFANTLLVDPVDPNAFYHQRYLLPAVPLLLIGAAAGLSCLRFGTSEKAHRRPLLLFVVLCLYLGFDNSKGESLHYHNNVRNVNEVQRELGVFLEKNTAPDSWIATVDAGAVRYFARRRTIDIIGLNTPEYIWEGEAWTRARPVEAFVFIPRWLEVKREDRPLVEHAIYAETLNYFVTSHGNMGIQVVGYCPRAAADEPTNVLLEGVENKVLKGLYCVPYAGQVVRQRKMREEAR